MSGMPLALDSTGGARLQAYLYAHIPLVHHLQVQVDACDTTGLTLSAPLAANVNHESTAFGGSLDSLATLSCWGMVWLLLEPDVTAHIVVAESHMRFLQPVSAALRAHCPMPGENARRVFFATLERRHKARIGLQSRIVQNNSVCAEFDGRFAAFRGEHHGG